MSEQKKLGFLYMCCVLKAQSYVLAPIFTFTTTWDRAWPVCWLVKGYKTSLSSRFNVSIFLSPRNYSKFGAQHPMSCFPPLESQKTTTDLCMSLQASILTKKNPVSRASHEHFYLVLRKHCNNHKCCPSSKSPSVRTHVRLTALRELEYF
jgi:hypothetical protein